MENVLEKGPAPVTAADLNLPETAFDQLPRWGPKFLYVLLSKVSGLSLKDVSLPEGLTGKNRIPEYALREFHNLPNGYYSKFFASGYGNGFNATMLGAMKRVRKEMAGEFSGCARVLDLGCGDGSSTRALCDEGIQEVWGLDPSPYMLFHAIERSQGAKFVQSVAEKTDFLDASFDGVSACWVFHEVPARVCDLILMECFRILKPGGKLVIVEPSKHQFRSPYFQLLRDFGLRGLYYRFLANFPNEPYINEWHNIKIQPWLENHGFKMVSNVNGMPEESIVAVKPFS
jgi:ubiquinone/menaquinone biosynthesis C-methylase UbiE